MARNFIHRHVHLRNDRRREKWLAGQEDIRSGGAEGVARTPAYIDAKGDISNVCEGTNKKNDLNYYLTRARNTGDLHGEAPILWSASALLR